MQDLAWGKNFTHFCHLLKKIKIIHPASGDTIIYATETVMIWIFHRWKVAQISKPVSDYRGL